MLRDAGQPHFFSDNVYVPVNGAGHLSYNVAALPLQLKQLSKARDHDWNYSGGLLCFVAPFENLFVVLVAYHSAGNKNVAVLDVKTLWETQRLNF